MIMIMIIIKLTVAFSMNSNYKKKLPLFLQGILNQRKHHTFISLI